MTYKRTYRPEYSNLFSSKPVPDVTANMLLICPHRVAGDVFFNGTATDCRITVKNLKGEYNGNWTCG
jgi:hypothetical protein